MTFYLLRGGPWTPLQLIAALAFIVLILLVDKIRTQRKKNKNNQH